MLLDSHCHLDLDIFEPDRGEVIERARAAGVEQMIVIGFNPGCWESGAQLCREFTGLHLAVGLHPTEAETYNDTLETRLRETAISERAVAIGETGIDYHWKPDTANMQKEAFARQIALSKDLDLPFIVHQREAERDTLDVLKAASPPHRGVMHCFTGDDTFLRECLDLGLHIGVGGAVTFRKLKALHAAIQAVPLDRIILETDAPFMTPSPHRGQRNEPAYLLFIAERVAELRDVSASDIAEATTSNARELFRLAGPSGTSGQPARKGR